MIRFIHMFIVTILLAVLLGCNRDTPAHDLEHLRYTCSMHPFIMEQKPGLCPVCSMKLVKVTTDHSKTGNEVYLSDMQIRLANIQVDTARVRTIGDELTLSAVIREDQTQINAVTARIAGRIEHLFVRNVGEQVHAGQALFELYSEELITAQQEYLLTQHNVDRSRTDDSDFPRVADAARNKLLLWGMTEKQIADLVRRGEPSHALTVYSKYSGVTTDVAVAEGDYIEEGTALLRIVKLDMLWGEAQLYVTDLPLFETAHEALMEFPSVPDQRQLGAITFVSPSIESASKILLVRMGIANPNGKYRPGMQALMTLRGNTRNAIAVPSNALIHGKDGVVVWLKTANGAFISRMVSIGKTNRDFTEITQGLRAGESVVVSGAYLLHSEMVFKNGSDQMVGHDMETKGRVEHEGH